MNQRDTFSIPKADRWAAARTRQYGIPRWVSFQYPQSGSMGCSLLLVRHLLDPQKSFQYPQSGSMGCSSRTGIKCAKSSRQLSVSPKRIDGLQPSSPQDIHRLRQDLSVSPKRIDGLQRPGGCAEPEPGQLFQYPQSGSMGCSPPPPGGGGGGTTAFSIPKADRWAAASWSSRVCEPRSE